MNERQTKSESQKWFAFSLRYLRQRINLRVIFVNKNTVVCTHTTYENYVRQGKSVKGVRHINKSFGYTPLFTKDEFEIKNIEIIVNFDAPLIVSRFINSQNGKPVYFIVNNDREKPTKINIEYKDGAVTDTHGRLQAPDGWLAPGQATIIEL